MVSRIALCLLAIMPASIAMAQTQNPDSLRLQMQLPQALEGPIDPDEYILGPSDELLFIVRGAESTADPVRVLPEGNVVLPNIGAIRAAGLTLTEFRARVHKELGRYYRNTNIDIQLWRPRTFSVFVLGEVHKPGPVELVAPFRVSRAILAAGNVKLKGSIRQIEIREDGETVRTVDLFSFFELGAVDQNPMLKERQAVYVPPRKKSVDIIGEVRKPGNYELLAGETAGDMLRACGGVTSRGDEDKIMIERRHGEGERKNFIISADSADAYVLQDLDVMVIREIMSFDGTDPVRVLGGGGRQGTFYVGNSEPLVDFLPRIWRFHQDWDTETAVLEKEVDGKPKYIRFSVRDVIDGDPVGQTPVEPGDVISFGQMESSVFVAGQVQSPGPIPFQPGHAAERYIALAGGPTSQGSFDRLAILSRDGVERSGNRHSPVYRGDTIVVNRRKGAIAGSYLVGLTSITGLVVAIIALINTNN